MQKSIFEDQVKFPLSLFRDDKGTLRCGGCLEDSPIPFDDRFPIFLPRLTSFTGLVIHECHLKALHISLKDTVSRFRVTKAREAVRTAIGNYASR